MANLLYIDTASTFTFVAISQTNIVSNSLLESTPNVQAAQINVLIDKVLQLSNLQLNELDAVVVNAGPGSYTGLRVGLGTAKGICYSLDKPLILCNKLEMLANEYVTENQPINVWIKARVGEAFYAKFDKDLITVVAPEHVFTENFDLNTLTDEVIVTDDELMLSNPKAIDITNWVPDIEAWATLANKRFDIQDFDDVAYGEPFYMKSVFTTTAKKKVL